MSHLNHLIMQFQDVGLKLKPWSRSDEIFAMDIRGDSFLMSIGGEGNEVAIQAHDKGMKQLVLNVKELRRRFEITIHKDNWQKGDRVVQELERGQVRVSRLAPEARRRLLVGLDEMGHPFATALPEPAVSVKAAHEILKPIELRDQTVRGKGKNYKTGKQSKKAFRQGEWFFIEATPEEISRIKILLVERLQAIGPVYSGESARGMHRRVRQVGGNPHMADEIVVVHSARREIFVRGKVRHAEHKTLNFGKWMRVVKNTELNARSAGVNWID